MHKKCTKIWWWWDVRSGDMLTDRHTETRAHSRSKLPLQLCMRVGGIRMRGQQRLLQLFIPHFTIIWSHEQKSQTTVILCNAIGTERDNFASERCWNSTAVARHRCQWRRRWQQWCVCYCSRPRYDAAEYCDEHVCLSVCPRAHLLKYVSNFHQFLRLLLTYSRGLVLLWRRCDTLLFGSMDDVNITVWIPCGMWVPIAVWRQPRQVLYTCYYYLHMIDHYGWSEWRKRLRVDTVTTTTSDVISSSCAG